MYTYIGCRTTKERNARGLGIRIFDVNEKWIPSTIVDSFDNPSYLITDNNKKFIYAVHGDFDKVSSYKIEGDGNLTFLNRVDSTGKTLYIWFVVGTIVLSLLLLCKEVQLQHCHV